MGLCPQGRHLRCPMPSSPNSTPWVRYALLISKKNQTRSISRHLLSTLTWSAMGGIRKSVKWPCVSSLVLFCPQDAPSNLFSLESSWSQYLYFESAASLGPYAPFSKTDTINIPDAIYDQFNQTETQAQMGIFSEIDRAWVTVDNKLFFWNYKNGSDFHTFDELDQAISAVALVVPKKGMFIESINHVLVISTSKDLYLIALAYDKSKNELDLYETGMAVSVSGLEVSNITGSTSGRIFITGKSHGVNISEINYSNVETWFKGKCTRTCHTSHSAVSSLFFNVSGYDRYQLKNIPVVGSLLANSTPEVIVSVSIDNSRSLLYTLSNSSVIRMYSMDKSGGLTLLFTYTLAQIISHIQMIPTPSSQETEDPKTPISSLTLVSIQVIEARESSRLNLIAITSTGSRIYIKAANTLSSSRPPNTMQAVQQRFPPASAMTTAPKSTTLLASTTPLSRIFAPGYYFAVVEGRQGHNVFVSAPDSGKIIAHTSAGTVGANPVYSENACFLDVEGFVQEIAMITPYTGPKSSAGFANESATQYTVPNPQVVVLTNTGVHIFTRKYPYQVFEQLGQDIRSFFEFYGRNETCANALSVATRTSTFPADECDFASKVFIEIGGKPHLKVDDENTYSLSQSQGSAINKFSTSVIGISGVDTSEVIRLSGRFDGLATYVTRVVSTLWKSNLFNVTKNGNGKRFSFATERKSLEAVQIVLLEISEYLDKNRTFIDGLSGGPDNLLALSGRSEELSLQAEHRGLHALVALIKSMKEGIAFLILLIDESKKTPDGLESITSFLPQEIRDKLEPLTFKQFFATESGTDLARELITCLVNRNISDGGSVDSISTVLQDRCVSYCSADDVIIYKALEYLRKAESLESNARIQKLNESLQLFQKAAGSIHYDVLKDAINEFVKLRFYPGAVELALTVAQEEDRGNLAVAYLNEGANPNDSRKEQYDKRVRVYELIFSILEKADEEVSQSDDSTSQSGPTPQQQADARLRDETYFVCYSSPDGIFHYNFYDWFISKDVIIRLLNIETPFILPFLEMKAKTDLKIANILWTYHQKRGDSFAAADVLFVLAKSDFDLSLSQRIEYLSRARTYCSCPYPPNLQQAVMQLSTSIQEYLDVANIQDEILRTVINDPYFDEERKEAVIAQLQSELLTISDLFNNFADPLKYYEISLLIFQTTDYRGSEEISNCWNSLITQVHNLAVESDTNSEPYEYVSQTVQKLGQQLMLSEFTFPADFLISRLETYAVEFAADAPQGWVVDTFLSAGMSFEALLSIFTDLLERRDYPFDDAVSFKKLALDVTYLLNRFLSESRTLNLSHIISLELLSILESTVGVDALKNIKTQMGYR